MNNPEDVTALENSFAEEIKKKGDDFKFFKDQFGEHPEERANNEEITEKLADYQEQVSNLEEEDAKESIRRDLMGVL